MINLNGNLYPEVKDNTKGAVVNPTITAVYVNFYQVPGNPTITSSVHNSRDLADGVWQPPPGGWPVSKKERIACIRVPVLCVDGQFDL